MDVNKLTPAPWTWQVFDQDDVTHKGCLRGLDGKIVLGPTNEGDIAITEDDAALISLAREAFDVMTRRGWGVQVWYVPQRDMTWLWD